MVHFTGTSRVELNPSLQSKNKFNAFNPRRFRDLVGKFLNNSCLN